MKKSELENGMIIVTGEMGGGIVNIEENCYYPLNTCREVSLNDLDENLKSKTHISYDIIKIYKQIYPRW